MLPSEFYLFIILTVLSLTFLLENLAKLLNLSKLRLPLPNDFEDVFSSELYQKNQEYTRTKTIFSLISSSLLFAFQIYFILRGGFKAVDYVARSFSTNEVVAGLIFFGYLFIILKLVTLPFALYSTFVIEEKFGFNRMTLKTFLFDELKSILLTGILGGIVLSVFIWFFGTFGADAWLPVWGFVIGFSLLMIFLYPILLAPIFNRFMPLPDGELKHAIETLSDKLQFKRQGLFTMDGSKRSSKSNAYFTGFGKFRRIVLFDTLIEKHSISELLAILAHEIGHYKLKHIVISMVKSFLILGFWLWLFSKFLDNQPLFEAFKVRHISVYGAIVFFSFLMTPISSLVEILTNWFSRKNEYAADRFAAIHTSAADMIAALKRLAKDNLSNLTPHPLMVWLEYDHPPVLDRINALKKIKVSSVANELGN